MFMLGKTRPLPGHSSIGSISTRKKLHPGVPPPTTESSKGGSVPAIWQNQARRLPGVHPEYSDTASGSLFGDTEERYHQPIDRSGLTPSSRLQRSVGQRYSQDTVFLLTGRRIRQTGGSENQRC
ncbi:hypothetical protein TNCV_673281 [Trichonephila clavipes]|uniref:Uncharacterized protein n=1 Tax=Trichonephila clavipes TaxID=2585209 RepID=A0A8X6WCN0_TRICX|nr:hypothetical protein TNCV_673281 [Trichonephila clavipes]